MLTKYAALLVLSAGVVHPAIACSENDIHRATVACYTDCVSRYFDEPTKQECIQGCVREQDKQREACGVFCKNVGGSTICY
jgi:hypothetical protein